MQKVAIRRLFIGLFTGYALCNESTTPLYEACLRAMSDNDEGDTSVPVDDICLWVKWLIKGFLSDERTLYSITNTLQDADSRRTSLVALAYIGYLVSQDRPLDSYFTAVWEQCAGHNFTFDQTWRKIGHVLGWGSVRHSLQHIGTDTQPSVIITQMMFCILRSDDNLDSLLTTAKHSVAPSVVASLTLGILYTKQAFEIPDQFTRLSEKDISYITHLADKFSSDSEKSL